MNQHAHEVQRTGRGAVGGAECPLRKVELQGQISRPARAREARSGRCVHLAAVMTAASRRHRQAFPVLRSRCGRQVSGSGPF